jgi:hypothetical protein
MLFGEELADVDKVLELERHKKYVLCRGRQPGRQYERAVRGTDGLLASIIRWRETIDAVLAAIERLIVTAHIGVAKSVAVWAVGAEGRVVAGSVVKSAVVFRMVTETVIGITRSIFRAGPEPFMVGPFDEWRSGGVGRGRGGIVRMLSAAGDKKTGERDKRECNMGELHGVLTIRSHTTIVGCAFG